ncbi:MAG: PQQ-binding-like beta-propeller repeat protein [Gammaproteobacteria bacterium]|nr:PQQ-binding-like beta-propeller repeat protein [Gammaproteobacteria bacterium]
MLMFKRAALALTAVSILSMAGCGGGDGNSSPSMSLSTHQISVSVKTTDPAPVASVEITVHNPPPQTVYVGFATTHNGLDSVSLASSNETVAVVDIQFKSPSQLGAGTYEDTLTLGVCLDQQCDEQIANSPQTISITFTVTEEPNPVPSLTSLSPGSVAPGSGAFTLTVHGTGFVSGSTVNWNGAERETNFVSSTQLTAEILATDVETSGESSVTVFNPEPGGGTSNSLAFTVQYETPTIARMYPDATVEGGPDFTLTLIGDGFGPDSQVKWNGGSHATDFVSSTELTAQIGAADIANAGTATVAVLNPAPGGSSDPATFTIKPYVSDAVAFQIDANHSGVMHFNPVSFPSQSAWSVDVGGEPSYALIADDKVFVTVEVNGNARLLALDQTTGTPVWGPVALSYTANAAYDAGSVFVVSSSPFSESAFMQAYDTGTGSLEWSIRLEGQRDFTSGPTALNGFVYTGGAGTGGTLYAVDENDGTIVWTQGVENGANSTPAVSADGVYVAYPCHTYDFRPATGELVWQDSVGCTGGGGASPVVANGKLYAPNGFGSYDGAVFDAETGDLLGSYVADNPPAIAQDDGYFLQNGILYDIDLGNGSIVWGFAGDGDLVTSPIVINQYVFVGASSGNLYALDRQTGQQVWQIDVGAPIPPGAGWGAAMQLTGLSAGHGLLIVPAGNSVVAYRLASD